VYVNYTVKVAGTSPRLAAQQALMVDLALQAVKPSTLATNINTQLSVMGLSAAVHGAALSVSPLRIEERALEESSSELSKLAAMHKVFSQHFGEASDELSSLRNELQQHNQTSAELKLLKAKHAAAVQELATLGAVYTSLQKSLEEAQLAFNATNSLRQKVLDTAQQLVTAQGSSAASPATLDDTREAHLKAERLLLQALANYSLVNQEIRQNVGRHQQASRSVADMSMALAQLRKLLWQVTHNDLAQTLLNLSQAILREQTATEALKAEQAAHEQTRQQLWQAQVSHKEAMEDVDISEAKTIAIICVSGVGLVLAICALSVVLICWFRNRWDSRVTPVVPFHPVEPSQFVVGSPIGKAMPQSVVTAPCRSDSKLNS